MKNFLLIFLMSGSFAALAQKPLRPDLSQYKDVIKMAQEKLDSVAKEHPGMDLKGYAPKAVTAPDVDKLQKQLDKSSQAVAAAKQETKQKREESLPKPNATSNVSALPAFGEQDIIAIAQQMLPAIEKGLDSADLQLKKTLDQTVNDTGVNAAGTGVMFMAAGVLKYIPEYLICKDVINNPGGLWKINDLGIVLRNERKYKQAIQCFTYACNFSDSLYKIRTNLAWATFYYGDFVNAKKFFNEALLINPDFNNALEGLALVSYRQGDISALFKCLMKEAKTAGGGGAGPSEDFMNVCGGVMTEQEMKKLSDGEQRQTDPTKDNTFDNPEGDSGNEEVLAEGNEDQPAYPNLGGLFAQNIDQLGEYTMKVKFFTDLIKRLKEAAASKVASKLPAARLSPQSKYDADGNRSGTYDFSRFYTLFHKLHEQYQQRMSYINTQYEKDMQPLLKNILTANADLIKQYSAEVAKAGNQQMLHEIECKYAPVFKGMKSADLGAISELWTKNFRRVIGQSNWYISASSPWIKRMLRDDWNTYMNAIREGDIRDARLNMYSRWVTAQTSIGGIFQPFLEHFKDIVCITQIRVIDNGPNPDDVPLKKLKTAPDYCDPASSTYSAEAGFGSFSADCKGWKITLGSEDNHLVFKKVIGKHKEDDFYRGGIAVGMGVSQTIKASGAGNSAASIKASAHVEVEAGYTMNAGGEITGKYADLDVSMGIKGKVTTGNDNMDQLLHTAHFGHGMDVHVEMVAVKGQDGYGSWNGNVSGTKY